MNTGFRYALRARCRSALSSSATPSSSSTSPMLCFRRQLGTKPRAAVTNVDLVGPCDPVSNIRPVQYASSPSASTSTSPYSTSEFSNAAEEEAAAAADRVRADARIGEELEWRLRRERVDAKNHEFWAVTNTLFQTHLDHRLSTLLPPPPPSDAPADILAAYNQAKDQVLTEFYRDWLEANKERQSRWIKEWWVDVGHEVWDGLKRSLRWR